MKVLIACEESQVVCIAFRERGHEAYSCDLIPCSGGHPEWHIQDDVLKHLGEGWDMMIAHPPCTYLSYAGAMFWNLPGRKEKRDEAVNFFLRLWNAPINKICIENPHSYIRKIFKQPDQEIHPYYFGDKQMKRTCLWLRNLPKLIYGLDDTLFWRKTATEKPQPSFIRKDGNKQYFCSVNRNPKLRSKTFPGIARAMAEQWG